MISAIILEPFLNKTEVQCDLIEATLVRPGCETSMCVFLPTVLQANGSF